ncbi:metal-sensitive transcriptional regulator [Arthrobacter sp. SDTb3-6]|uniref:metal-sensitive transcriptional regulator n=1 Tax=Arthrobacter sp. SDTb3-6 TaxID=2713571 RepID=UPI00159DDAC2|nr:metal-sensitive transcriptional regulator [Arthrobacter sp. SDTb3-6]NVN00511.1 metal-sensitive transcriptional regulator [Arthrobacter sp. SDTb3-6]
MQLSEEASKPIINRLRRANGQLTGIIRMLEERRDCEDIVMQMAAVGKALDRAGFGLVAGSLKECLASGQSDDLDSGKLEKLFLSLA